MGDLSRVVARVWGVRSSPVGTAFLVGPRTLLTCTHVVAQARGLPRLVTPAPGSEVDIDFPADPGGRAFAEIVHCEPVEHGDITVLELPDDAPAGIRPAVLVEVRDLWQQPCRTFGFPRGFDDGDPSSGVLLSPSGEGWLVIDNGTGRPVEPGFSGAPVWVDDYRGVVAMMVAARSGERAYAIAVRDLMAAWPPLRELARPASPYRGLNTFTPADAAVYHGRDADIDELAALVRREPVVAIVGPSGVGKSSLALAGLIPRLEGEGVTTAYVRLRPHTDPPSEVQDAHAAVVVLDQLDEVLVADPGLAEAIDRAVARTGARVVVTLRDDLLHLAKQHTPTIWSAWDRLRFSVRPMGREQLREVITLPLRTVRPVQPAPGLDELILDDAPPGAATLPLVELTLSLLWDRQDNAELTLAAYRSVGGVGGALARDADLVLERLTEQQREAAQALFVQLVRPGEEGRDFRRTARREDLSPAQWELAHRLADTRLLTVAGGEDAADGTVELAHEALIGAWPRLAAWAGQARAFRAWQERLRAALHAWRSAPDPKRRNRLLLRGRELREARPWLRGELPAHERAFIRLSRRRRRTVQARIIATAAVVLAMVAVVAVRQAADTDAQRRIALSRKAAALSDGVAQDDIQLARRLSAAAWRIAPTHEARLSMLTGVLHPARLSLAAHEPDVRSVVYSPDGARLATGGDDRTAKIWDAATGRQLAVLSGHTERVYSAVFNQDGSRVATASMDGTARIWDAATGRELTVLTRHTGELFSVAFNGNGTRLATVGAQGDAHVWDAVTGHRIATLTGHASHVYSATFSPDGTYLATAGEDDTARIWDPATGRQLAVLPGHTRAVFDVHFRSTVAFSPDAKRVATAGNDGAARIWDAATGRLLVTLSGGHSQAVWALAFTPDGTRLATAASEDSTARVWDIATGKQVAAMTGHRQDVYALVFSPEGTRLATAGLDRTARVWDALTGRQIVSLDGHLGPVTGVVFRPDGANVATADNGGTARVWDVTTGRQVVSLAGHAGYVYSVEFDPDGARVVTAAGDGTARVWDASDARQLTVLSGHRALVAQATFSPDGSRVATAAVDGIARVWDAVTGRQLAVLSGHASDVLQIEFSRDGRRLATRDSESTVRIWDADSGRPVAVLTGGTNTSFWAMAFSPDSTRLATTTNDGSAQVWDAATGRRILTLTGHTGSYVYSVAFTRDGTRLVTAGDDGTARVWDATSGRLVSTVHHGARVDEAIFSHDAHRLATRGDDRIARIWEVATGRQIAAMTGHTGPLSAMAFGPGDTFLATAGYDDTARLWDTVTGKQITVLAGHLDAITAMVLSPDGTRMATAGQDGVARLWNVALPADPFPAICALAAGPLTDEQRAQYLDGEPVGQVCP